MRWIKDWRLRRRGARVNAALPQDLSVMESGLRAGTSLLRAIQLAAQDSEGPLAEEWRLLLQEVQLGVTLPQALQNFEQRLPLPAIQSLMAALLILQETGGNTASVLHTLAQTLRQEAAFQGKLQALTAQGKMSGVVVSAMPFLILAALCVLTPDLARPLFVTSLGRLLLGLAAVLLILGGCCMKRIVTIEV